MVDEAGHVIVGAWGAEGDLPRGDPRHDHGRVPVRLHERTTSVRVGHGVSPSTRRSSAELRSTERSAGLMAAGVLRGTDHEDEVEDDLEVEVEVEVGVEAEDDVASRYVP